MSRDMLNKGEVEELQNMRLYLTASARCIKLATCIPNKAKNALERFYLSLMDSCGRAGLGQHYHLANNIRQRGKDVLYLTLQTPGCEEGSGDTQYTFLFQTAKNLLPEVYVLE